MSMRKRPNENQGEFWTQTDSLAVGPGHPFYARLNELLAEEGFDRYAESLCEPYYAGKLGRPSIAPGVYFRILLIGYFERIDSERGIAWRCADSFSLREFLGFKRDERTPDHSSLSRIRTRLPLEVHRDIFNYILTILARNNFIDGKTIGVDATTLEANAALRSIVRRDTDQGYDDFLTDLAKASGIETPTREDLAKIDRKRSKKGSNDDWHNPHDPDAQISKMKNGSTHMAHKAEHAVDMSGDGAVLAVTLHGGAEGDTKTLEETLSAANENIEEVSSDAEACLHVGLLREIVADKGYFSNEVLTTLGQQGYRTYISERVYKNRNWDGKEDARKATRANRRRVTGDRGKALLRRRGELLERPFAHYLEAGGMRRTHLRGHQNILKRLLIHVAGFNLAIMMRALWSAGTPKEYVELARRSIFSLRRLADAHISYIKLISGYPGLRRYLSTRFMFWNFCENRIVNATG